MKGRPAPLKESPASPNASALREKVPSSDLILLKSEAERLSTSHPQKVSEPSSSSLSPSLSPSAVQQIEASAAWNLATHRHEGFSSVEAEEDSSSRDSEEECLDAGRPVESCNLLQAAWKSCMAAFFFSPLSPCSPLFRKRIGSSLVAGLLRVLNYLQSEQRKALLRNPSFYQRDGGLDQMQSLVLELSGGTLKAQRHCVYTADGFRLFLYLLQKVTRTCCREDCRCLQIQGIDESSLAPPFERFLQVQERPVFYFQHGLLESSLNWISGGKTSLPFMLASAGAEVWVGNNRGNEYSIPPSAEMPRPCAGKVGFNLNTLEEFIRRQNAEAVEETDKEMLHSPTDERLCSDFCCQCSGLTSVPDIRGASLDRQLCMLRQSCYQALCLLLRLKGFDAKCGGGFSSEEKKLPPFFQHLDDTCDGNWSFHEMAVVDFPAQVQFVAKNSPTFSSFGGRGICSLVAFGQSQGAAQILACLSLCPSLSKVISQVVVFSPPLLLQPLAKLPRGAVFLLRLGLARPVLLLKLLRLLASSLPAFALGAFGEEVAGLGHGLGMRFYTTPIERKQREVNFRFTPSGGTSLRNLAHWLHLLTTGNPLSQFPFQKEASEKDLLLRRVNSCLNGVVDEDTSVGGGEGDFVSKNAKAQFWSRDSAIATKSNEASERECSKPRRAEKWEEGAAGRYPIENIQSVVHAFLGEEDNLVDAKASAAYLRASLKQSHLFVELVRGVGHLDFGWGRDRHSDLYPRLVSRLLRVAAASREQSKSSESH